MLLNPFSKIPLALLEALEYDVVKTLISEETGEAVSTALRTFLARDSYFLEVDANERSMTPERGLGIAHVSQTMDIGVTAICRWRL